MTDIHIVTAHRDHRSPPVSPDRSLADGDSVPGAPRRRDRQVEAAVAASTCALGGAYLWAALANPAAHDPRSTSQSTPWLGLDRWAFLHQPWPWVFLSMAVVTGGCIARWPARSRRALVALSELLGKPWARVALAATSTVLCWIASTRQENLDGSLLQQKVADGVARTGAFVTHDEMLELYTHSVLWAAVHARWGWDVAQTYRATSCLAGGVAVFLALGLIQRFPPSRWPVVVVGLFAGGWVLIFFGDVENYTLTNVAVLAYLLVAVRYLEDETAPLWPTGALLAVAVLFHLESLALAPSLLVLAVTAVRRGQRVELGGTVAIIPAMLGAAMWWFDQHGLPLSALTQHSQISAQGGDWSRFMVAPEGGYLWNQLQLLLLLAPGVVLLPTLLVGRTFTRAPYTTFLAVATVGPLLMLVLWRAQLGAYEDWDLYAVTAQPISLLIFSCIANQRRLARQAPWLAAMLILMSSQAAAWIIEHHTMTATP